jgi:TonB family protein
MKICTIFLILLSSFSTSLLSQFSSVDSYKGIITCNQRPVLFTLHFHIFEYGTYIKPCEIIYQDSSANKEHQFQTLYFVIHDSLVFFSKNSKRINENAPDAYISDSEIRVINNSFFLLKPDQNEFILPRWKIPTNDVIFEITSENQMAKDTTHSIIADFAEVEPQFPGGEEAMKKFISENLKYPTDGTHTTGTVYVQFVVRSDGSLTDITVLKGVAKSLDEEAVRIISVMPKWIPGSQNGKVIAVRYQIPIRFYIE